MDGDTEGVFVSFVDGSEVEGIAYLAGKLRFRPTETEGPQLKEVQQGIHVKSGLVLKF